MNGHSLLRICRPLALASRPRIGLVGLSRMGPLGLCWLLVSSLAGAQEPSSNKTTLSSGSSIQLAGSGAGAPAETQFGLSGIYGTVSGQAGVYGDRVGGAKKDVPPIHLVRKGDTLWGISEDYYGNPWAWPKVWSLNPQIENPHWIYPGDQLRTSSQKVAASRGPSEDNSAGGGGFVGRQSVVPPGTVFIRDQGYIGDPERDVWGEVVGAHEPLMMLTDGQVVYLKMNEGTDLRIGQRLTVFDDIADPPSVEDGRDPPGKIVKVFGTVRIDAWDPKTRVARTSLIESIDAIERGFKVGPVGRRFDVVPPEPAIEDVEAKILTGMNTHMIFAQNEIVFIDRGKEDKLSPGNRLRVLRRGDTWRRQLATTDEHARMRVEMGAPELPDPETTPLRGDDEEFPDEVVGELLVLRTEDYSSICLVIEAAQHLEPGERAVAVAGY